MDAETLRLLGITLILTGIAIILVVTLLLFISSIKSEKKVKAGGAIIIGPFPIIFGTDKESTKTILLLSIILTLLLIVTTVIFYFMHK